MHHLRKRGYVLVLAETLAEAENQLRALRFDLVLLDDCLPDGAGLSLLRGLTRGQPRVVMMSARGSAETAVASIRAGAFDFLVKPLSLDEVDLVLQRVMAQPAAPAVRPTEERQTALTGTSPAMTRLREMVRKIAPTEAPVLIRGEAGSVKEAVAAAIHRASPRAEKPFLRINCGAGGEERIEKELFGEPESGACGLVELAQGGTLLLEEVSDLSLRLQVRLLRLLQECSHGAQPGRPVAGGDFRLMATTTRDLADQVARGSFRQDLLFRLNVFPLHIPPLRERQGDIAPIVAGWIEGHRGGAVEAGISQEAMRRLEAYHWPGNARELENALERALILSGGHRRLEAADFDLVGTSARLTRGDEREPLLTLNELEKRHVLRALEYTNQNRTRAAGLLQISVRTLRNKLHQYRQEDGTLPGLPRPGGGLYSKP